MERDVHVLRTESAEVDLDAIVDHYGPLNPTATLAMLDRIAETEALLTQYPHLGRPGRIADTREMVVTHTSFIIVYVLDAPTITVLRVLHGRQQWPEKSDS